MISGLGNPTSQNDAVTKTYLDRQMFQHWGDCNGWCGMIHTNGGLYAPIHDPQFAEIEHILNEVGLKFIQVAAYATEYIPFGTEPQTAQCVTFTHKILANINSAKQFMIMVDKIDMYTLPGPAIYFDMHEPDFFLKLAQYLRKQAVLSRSKYWFVRLKLWWNK